MKVKRKENVVERNVEVGLKWVKGNWVKVGRK